MARRIFEGMDAISYAKTKSLCFEVYFRKKILPKRIKPGSSKIKEILTYLPFSTTSIETKNYLTFEHFCVQWSNFMQGSYYV